MCLPQVIESFQNYRGVATTFYPALVYLLLVSTNYKFVLRPLRKKKNSKFEFKLEVLFWITLISLCYWPTMHISIFLKKVLKQIINKIN
jgi:hypothetical protein